VEIWHLKAAGKANWAVCRRLWRISSRPAGRAWTCGGHLCVSRLVQHFFRGHPALGATTEATRNWSSA